MILLVFHETPLQQNLFEISAFELNHPFRIDMSIGQNKGKQKKLFALLVV
jgi:hypothetical protein